MGPNLKWPILIYWRRVVGRRALPGLLHIPTRRRVGVAMLSAVFQRLEGPDSRRVGREPDPLSFRPARTGILRPLAARRRGTQSAAR